MAQRIQLRELDLTVSWYCDVQNTHMRHHFKKAYKYAVISHLKECSTACIFPLSANSTSFSRQDAGFKNIKTS